MKFTDHNIHSLTVYTPGAFSHVCRTCSPHHNLIPEHLRHPDGKPTTVSATPPNPDVFLSLWICLFGHVTQRPPHSMCPFVSGFCHVLFSGFIHVACQASPSHIAPHTGGCVLFSFVMTAASRCGGLLVPAPRRWAESSFCVVLMTVWRAH